MLTVEITSFIVFNSVTKLLIEISKFLRVSFLLNYCSQIRII
jgi:hypothetical protein